MRWILLVLVMLFTGCSLCCAQPNLSDLKAKLNTTQQDTNRVNAFYNLSHYYRNKNPDSAIIMADSSLMLAQHLNFKKGIVIGYLNKGVSLVITGKYPEALSCHFKALKISEELKFDNLTAYAYNDIGIVYMNMADYPHAIEYYKRALAIVLKMKTDVSSVLVNMGEVFKKNNQPDSAIVYTAKALAMAEKDNDSISMAITLANLGEDYIAAKTYDKSLPFLNRALNISQYINDYEGIAYANNSLGVAYYHLGRFAQSIASAQTCIRRSLKLNLYQITKDAYHVLYLNYDTLSQYQQALYYRNAEISLADSLNTVEKNKQIKELQSVYDLEKKQQQVDRLKKEHTAQQKELTRNKITQTIGAGLVLLLGLLSLFLYINYTEKTKLSVQLKQRNDEVLLKNTELEEVNNMKNKMLSIVGHDLRGPISSLVGILDLMNSQSLTPEEADYFLTQANSSLTSTRHLLNNLLYWAKSQMEGMQVNAKIFDLQQIISQNIQLAKTRTKEKGIHLLQEGKLETIPVFADEMMIDLVLRNLIENAVKFSHSGNTVTLQTEKNCPFIKVLIKDNGLGITEEKQAKLFNKLTTETTYGTAREKGSGLGLLLCKELVEKNGGTIGFTSEPGKGSIFYFTVPATENKVSDIQQLSSAAKE